MIKIDLPNPKYCGGCPYLHVGTDLPFCKRYKANLKTSYPYPTSRNHAIRLEKCKRENGL